MKNLILTLLLVLGLAPMCLAQDDFSATALRLGGGFGEQAEAVEKLGLSGDPRALPLLQALADGMANLRAWPMAHFFLVRLMR
ncbi:MAG: hypothetical protein NTX90_05365 [Alphaproteobacteria bacterium]|nr:hypothetical protein [Alphaproteobacteria bacterium]